MIKKCLIFIALPLTGTTVFSEEQNNPQWTAGVVSMATYESEWSPAILPWLSYRNEHFSINPMQIALTGKKGALHWKAGFGLDYNELFDDTQRSFLAQFDTQYFWGPLRFTSAMSSRLTELTSAWQGNTTVGSQFPLGQGLIGAEIGLNMEASDWEEEASRDGLKLAPTVAVQYGLEFGQWQTMAIAQYQGSSFTTEDTAEQTYTLLVMRSW
jgi:hypothetical protein